jgi:hypothetical protein
MSNKKDTNMFEWIRNVQERAHHTASEKGWHDTNRSFAEELVLIHSEISEALEEFRDGNDMTLICFEGDKPVGIASELADVLIRLGDCTYGRKWIPLSDYRSRAGEDIISGLDLDCFPEALLGMHRLLSHEKLSDLVWLIDDVSEHFGIPLQAAVEAKMKYNETRPRRHGGKRC